MPFQSNAELPSGVKNNLPSHGQDIWRSAHNSAMEQYKGNEQRAAQTAWAAVKNRYKKDKDGKWVAKDAAENFLYDAFTIDFTKDAGGKLRRTADGYVTGYAKVARTGIQTYRGYEVDRPDMTTVRVYRPPEEVFHRDAMHSAAHRPVTLHHPPEMVNSKNWKKYAGGQTGDEIIRDGDHVRVPLILTDQDTIDAFEKGGVRELSAGYTTDLKWTPGMTADGEQYDAVQTAIRWNHLALVPRARGGATLRLGDQSSSATGEQYSNTEGRLECVNCGEEMSPNAEICPACFTPTGKGLSMDCMDYDKNFYELWSTIAAYDKEFSAERRDELAKSGKAMPGGGFPIESVQDLKNAVRAIGRAKNPSAAKAHIIKRAKSLGATNELPEDWTSSTKSSDAASSGHIRSEIMSQIMIDGIPVELTDRDAAVVQRHVSVLTKRANDAENAAQAANEEMEEEKKLRKQTDDAMKKAIDAKDGEIAVLKKQVADARVTPQVLDQMVKDRLGTIIAAKPILGDKFAFDGKSDADIRRATVSLKLGDGVAKDMNDDQIGGAFSAMTAAGASGVHALGDSIGLGNQQSWGSQPGFVNDGRNHGMTQDALNAHRDKAFADRDNYYANAWKGGATQQR